MRQVDWISALAAAIALCGSAMVSAQGQSNSLFGTQGPAGQIGSNLTGSIVGQSSTQGSTLGGTQLGATATGSGGFVGRNDNTGGFVGDQRVGQQSSAPTSQRQFGNRQTTSGGGGRANQARGNQAGGRGQGQAERRVIRPRREIAFQYPSQDTQVLSRAVRGRFSRLGSRDASLPSVTIEISAEGAALLTGAVTSENSRKLAEILISLEPGIRSVVNELTVVAAQ